MEIKLHANATTTPRVRRYIQQSDKSDRLLAQELGISVATVRRWRQRQDVADRHTVPKTLRKALTDEQSLLINWLRQNYSCRWMSCWWWWFRACNSRSPVQDWIAICAVWANVVRQKIGRYEVKRR